MRSAPAPRPTTDEAQDVGASLGHAQRWRRVAIIHYWLVGMRGGERVVERLLHLFPNADIFTHVYDPNSVSELIRSRPVHTSFIQKLPQAVKRYKSYLPLMPMALEQLDLRGYDLVISSESGPAKGVLVAPDAYHLCYCHSPMRYLWDHYHDYRASAGRVTRWMMPYPLHRLRQWDALSAQRIDQILCNSNFIRQRIRRSWGRDAQVVYPPVDVSLYSPSGEISSRYLWVGQLTRYKRADLALEAFNRSGLPLLMVGDGELYDTLRKRAGPNIEMIQRLDFQRLREEYAHAKALIFTAEEDFGIVPVEAMASGRPVIAFGRGGVRDSVVPDLTGMFFDEQTPESLMAAIERFEAWLPQFNAEDAINQARRFSPEQFDHGIQAALARA